jgi:hypothetical protein
MGASNQHGNGAGDAEECGGPSTSFVCFSPIIVLFDIAGTWKGAQRTTSMAFSAAAGSKDAVLRLRAEGRGMRLFAAVDIHGQQWIEAAPPEVLNNVGGDSGRTP